MNTKAAYSPHQLPKSSIKPLLNHIIVSDMVFDQRITTGGIILLNDNGTGNGIRPRWGRVYAIGPNQKDVSVGQWVMVAHGRWTRGIDIEDETGKITLRKIDPNDILLVSDDQERPSDETHSSAVHVNKQTRD